MTNPPIPEGFTPWEGGENPVPGKLVEIIYRTGDRITCFNNARAKITWLHVQSDPERDIIAYRVVSEGGAE